MVVGLFVIFETVMLVAFNSQTDRNRATIVFGATVIAGAFALYTYLQVLRSAEPNMRTKSYSDGIARKCSRCV